MDNIAPQLSGIYQLRDLRNNKIYIGSTFNLRRRSLEHFHRLRRKVHSNGKLQNYYNKYGKKNLKFEVIMFCSKNNLLDVEQRYLDYFNPFFNISPSVNGTTGYSHKKEHKLLMSEIKLEQYKNGLVPWNKGKPVPKETKEKISQTLVEYFKENSHPFEGKTHTEEAKKLMVAASHRRKGTHHIGKNGRVVKLDLKTLKPLKVYSSTGAAAEEVKLNGTIKTTRNKIAESITKDTTAYGYKWAYENNLDQTKLDELLET